MLYSIPFPAEKKGVFSKFFDFFQKGGQKAQREGEHQEQQSHQIRPPIAQPQKKRAEHPEVQPAAHQAKGRAVKADLPTPSPLGPEEQGGSGGQPEQQVQDRPQQRRPHPHPQDAEQIVHHSQRTSQQQGLDQRRTLLGYIHRHPPNRRLNRPPRSLPSGS